MFGFGGVDYVFLCGDECTQGGCHTCTTAHTLRPSEAYLDVQGTYNRSRPVVVTQVQGPSVELVRL